MTKLKQLFSIAVLQKLILIYMLAQPVVDIATSFLVRGGFDVTIGVVFRALFLALMGVYGLFFYRGPKRKLVVLYLASVVAFVAVQMAYLFLQGGMGVLFTNLKETIKVFYFPCVLVAFWALYKEFGYLVSERPLVAIGVFYTLTIFISFVTDTSFQSYNGNGYCGWFYAANEISAITLILSPMVFYTFTSREAHALLGASDGRKRLVLVALGAASVLLMLFASSYLATKAVFFGVVIYLICYLIWNVFRLEITHDKVYRFRMLAGLLMIAALAVLFFLASPIKNHLIERLPWFHKVQVQTLYTTTEATTVTEPGETTIQTTIEAKPVEDSELYRVANWILSNRLNFSRSVFNQYGESGIVTKLCGLGYTMQPSYRYDVLTAVEMDFLSVLVRHGIIGLLLFSAPFVALLCAALWRSLRTLKACLASLLWCTSLFQTMMAFAVGFLTGHTFVAPAVSIYVICSLLHFVAETNRIYEQQKTLPAKE